MSHAVVPSTRPEAIGRLTVNGQANRATGQLERGRGGEGERGREIGRQGERERERQREREGEGERGGDTLL